MSISKSIARLTPIAAACCAVFAAAPASAAVVASFDPAYNFAANNPDPDMNNIGFKGTITLDPSSGCGTPGYTYTSNGGYNQYGTCSISVEGAHIDFYNATTDAGATHILSSIDLAGSFFASDYVYGAYFDPDGQLAGFDTYNTGNFQVAITDTSPASTADYIHYNDDPTTYFYGTYPDQLQLYFVSGQEPIYECEAECVAEAAYNGIDPGYLQNFGNYGNNDPTTSQPAVVTFAPAGVPEPETVALTLLGFGALAYSRRRRTTGAEPDQAEASRPAISAA